MKILWTYHCRRQELFGRPRRCGHPSIPASTGGPRYSNPLAGLRPGHPRPHARSKGVDARVKPAHDKEWRRTDGVSTLDMLVPRSAVGFMFDVLRKAANFDEE